MDENGGMVNPTKLRFTELDIAPHFKDTKLPKVEEAVALIKVGILNPAEIGGELTVQVDKDGVVWCEDNPHLYVLRKAGVNSVKVKSIKNDFNSGRLDEEDKKKLSDPAFMPRIRGGTESPMPGCPNEGGNATSLLGIVGAISGAVAIGYGAWKLYNQLSQTQSHHHDDKDNVGVNPRDLRFTQLDIGRYFKDRESPTVEETARLIRQRRLDPAELGRLTVHRDKENVMWCENNRRLYALREAGANSVNVKVKNNDFHSRRHKEEDKKKLSDPAFRPRFRGGTSSSSSQSTMRGNETSLLEIMGAVSGVVSLLELMAAVSGVASLLKIMGAVSGVVGGVSGVVGAGYAAWKLFSQSHHDDDDM